MIVQNILNYRNRVEQNCLTIAFFIIAIFLFQSLNGFSATITSKNGGGVWSSSGTWKGNNIPGIGDLVIIATTGSDAVTLTGNEACAGITIENGSILTAGTFTLSVAGSWLNNGTFNQGTGIIAFVGASAEINSGSGTANFNTIRIESGATLNINTGVTVAGNFDFVLPNANNLVNLTGANTLTISGNMNMELPINTRKSTMAVDAGTLNLNGTLNMGATTIGNKSNNLEITSGTANLNAGISTGTTDPTSAKGCKLRFTGVGGVINLQGALSGGPPNIIPDLGTFNFKGVAAQNIWKETYYNLGLYDGTKALADNIGVNNQLNIITGATLNTGSFNITFNGNTDPLLISGTLDTGTGTINFSGASPQTIPARTYYNLRLTDLGVKTIPAASTITIENNLIVDSELDMSGSQNLVVNNNITGTGAITMGSGTISLKNNWLNTGTFTKGTGKVIYNGTNQNVAGLAYSNLDILESGTKTLLGDASVSNVLNINSPASFNLDAATLDLQASGTPLQNTGTLIPSTSTVNYSSASLTTILAIDYNNLDGSGGDRIFDDSSIIGIQGTFTPGVGTYTVNGTTVDFNGDLNQTIPEFVFNNVILSGTGVKEILGATEVTVNTIEIKDGPTLDIVADAQLNITN